MTRTIHPLTVEQIQAAAADFKEGLLRESRRCIRRRDSFGAMAALEGLEHIDNFVRTLDLFSGSQLGGRPKEPKPPKKRIRHIYIPDLVKEASPRKPLTKEQKETQQHAREVAAASRSMGTPKHY